MKIFRNIFKSEFLRNIGTLTSGTFITQVITIFSAPIVLRIYNPVDYGILGLLMVSAGLISPALTLQYHEAIIVAEKDEDANIITILVIIFNLLISLLSFAVFVLFPNIIYGILGSDIVGNWLYLVPFSVFFSGLNLILFSFAIRHKEFYLLSVNRVIAALLAPIFSISIGLFYAGPLGLIVGWIISHMAPTLLLLRHFMRNKKVLWVYDKKKMAYLLWRYKNFPCFSFPATFINNLSNQLPVIMLNNIAGADVVGYFNLANRMLGLPIQFLSSSISAVFRQRASRDYFNKGSCRSIFMRVFKNSLAGSFAPFLIFMLWGPQLFAFFFGNKWLETGTFVQILGILFMFKFVFSPLTYVTYIANKQWIGLAMDIFLLAVVAVIYFISYHFQLHYKISLLMYAISYSSLYLLGFAIGYRLSENPHYVKQN